MSGGRRARLIALVLAGVLLPAPGGRAQAPAPVALRPLATAPRALATVASGGAVAQGSTRLRCTKDPIKTKK